jgi:hypothetical protein
MRSEGNAIKNGKPTFDFFFHDNAPAHCSVLVKDFLAKNNLTTLKIRPYSPDLDLTDFYSFLLLKSALKGPELL